MDWGLILTLIAVTVAGFAAIVGLWMERDQARPPRWAWSLSVLIVLTTVVTVATSSYDSREDSRRESEGIERYKDLKEKSELLADSNGRLELAAKESKDREEKLTEDIARMLVKLDEMAESSEDTGLKQFVNAELSSQSRSNEEVVTKVAQRVQDEGGDPDAMLAKHLPMAELQRVTRRLKKKEERVAAVLAKRKSRRRAKAAQDEAEARAKRRARAKRKAKKEAAQSQATEKAKQAEPADEASKAKPDKAAAPSDAKAEAAKNAKQKASASKAKDKAKRRRARRKDKE